jgi:ABC-type branched-subunit amino acid transport system substrate-binding protein
MVIPQQGPAGILGPSCKAITDLAVHELNQVDGILGRPVTVEFIDGGAPPEQIARKVRELLDAGRVDAVSGWHISSVREAIAPVVAERIPYIYTALYEGGEGRPGIFCSGEVPKLQVQPALRWLKSALGVRRWYIVGNDYIWPRGTTAAIRQYAQELDLDVVGESFIRLGGRGAGRLAPVVEASGCDGVLLLLVGQEAAEFNRSFAARGLHERIVRFSPMMEENMLLASGDAATENLYSSAGYFRSMATAGAMDLLAGYLSFHGATAPALNAAAESCYEGLQTLAHLVRRAGSCELHDLNRVFDRAAYHGPRGTVEFRDRHAAQQVYLASADGYDFDVITGL